ncbi:hypothetical protein EPA93_25155 [Ktedonosporobacter rubrisoli]|uniref:Response regulatory domain-containing protein n=1 Tax=Ktedonosporobacter rubrisoli TaxID=2509675 RepID=A0A4P6JUS3_KTERU|nr:hypothetical protein [Ktedonosporobacter rubrisoli]QBD79093.1 hypothetical protein EPA93_25155 [Ktedonosporobacter rubrisoli]
MNISTGGPHILLFERDQQLASLLTSELQLAGYECHSARTAVEVFDAIARHPVKLVLVNLAQAAAARREFWVALDGQRRGRGVQVLTFQCTNLAGYGSRDPEDRSSSNADLDIDGMIGLRQLVEAVRARIPSPLSNLNTSPRLSRTATPPPASSTFPTFTQRTDQMASMAMNQPPGETTLRSQPLTDSFLSQLSPRANPSPASTAPSQPLSSGTAGLNQPAYTDKIRAVLYPSQRSWSPPPAVPNNHPTVPEHRQAEAPAIQPTPSKERPTEPTALQRLASGQLSSEEGESGLAQLSRLLEERYSLRRNEHVVEQNTQHKDDRYEEERHPQRRNEPVEQYNIFQRNDSEGHNPEHRETPSAQEIQAGQLEVKPASKAEQSEFEQAFYAANNINYTPTQQPSVSKEKIGTQPLRASPIQGIPVERAANPQTAAETAGRRPEVLSRPNHSHTTAAQSSLASISTPTQAQHKVITPKEDESPKHDPQDNYPTEIIETKVQEAETIVEKAGTNEKNSESQTGTEHPQTDALVRQVEDSGTELDMSISSHNALLLDIVQSLPPMPSLPQSPTLTNKPPVLNGRATRTLGSVLLEGHLVPQNRLEVAQNIQRMLRGVDLNYQLGEILLMFKLLTPDQLLAASLVSYGLITTSQVSALGRIRQELHSIGLEYDLENLLILFRILTPEQLREVKTGWQG